ncbi:conjugative transfer relaxase/helicase TraI [Pseudomonadota bacterium]
MLSISPISQSAGDAASYYLTEEKHHDLPDVSLEVDTQSPDKANNYYLKEQSSEPNTQWFGKIAEQEGMLGKPVDEKQLEAVLSGHLNGTTVHGKRENHRNGFDFTFSAPKSVSVLALVGGDKRLIKAHDDAVKFTLSHMEKDAAQAKYTDEQGKTAFANTGNLLFAMVRHKTSREDEPQMHTHALASNMTKDEENTLRALASCFKQQGGVINGTGERIYNHQLYYGMLYQSHLSKQVEPLGYGIRSVGKGQFEIEGVPESYLQSQSTRSQQIDEHARTVGMDSAAARDMAAKGTRKGKSYASDASLMEKWQGDAKASDLDIEAFVASSYARASAEAPSHILKPAAMDAVQRAIDHSGQTRNLLGYEKIIESAATQFTQGEKLDVIDIKLAVDTLIQQGQLIGLNDSQSLFTTQTMIDNEQTLIASTQGQKRHLRTLVNTQSLEQQGLSADNQDKINALFASRKQTNIVNVFGQSQQIARALLHVGTESGQRVHIITPDTLSKQKTTANVPREAFTATQWVKNLFRPEHTHTVQRLLHDKDTPYSNRDLFVVEAANKLGVNEVQGLLDKAKTSNSKLIFLNHAKSRQGMKAGSVIETLKKGNVTEHSWVDTKEDSAKLFVHEKNDGERIDAIARAYSDLTDTSQVQVLGTTQKDVQALNASIRRTLQQRGDINRHGVTVKTLNPVFLSDAQREVVTHYKKGMVLSEWQKKHGRNVKEDFTVTAINRKDNLLIVKDSKGRTQDINPNTREAKARQFSISRPDSIEIARGDQLRVNGNHFASKLTQHQTLTVSSSNALFINMKDNNGKHHLLAKSQLQDAPLSYNFAQPLSKADETKAHTLIGMKSYAASKELLHDLNHGQANRIDVFTDSGEKLDKQLDKSDIQPSAIHRVMQATGAPEKFINSQTFELLRQDINTTLHTLKDQALDKGLIDSAVQYAIGTVSEKEAGFSQKQLVIEAIKYAFEEKGQAIKETEIVAHLKQAENNQQLLSAEYHDGTRWTTHAALETETRILERLAAGKNTVTPLATPEQANQYLEQHPRLTDGQKSAIHLITTTADRFVAVQGLAGTGKSTMLETGIALVKDIQANSPEKTTFIGLAPTHAAVNELKAKGVESQTAQSLLTDFLSEKHTPGQFSNTVFFLDESSMTSNQQIDQFTELVNVTGAHAVKLGDMYQLTSQEAGKPFELAITKNIIDSVTMKDIKRQQNDTLLGAVHNIVDRQGESAMEKIKQQTPFQDYQPLPTPKNQQQTKEQEQTTINQSHNVISTFHNTGNPKKDHENAANALPDTVALEYLSRTPASRENTLIIAYTNKERDDITHRIRQGLQQQKLLDTKQYNVPRLRSVGVTNETMATMMPYQAGLILRTGKDNYAAITHVDRRHGIVTVADMQTGEERPFYPKNHDHKFTQLWAPSDQPLAKNDTIMLRQTDKTRGWEGNKVYRVTDINAGQMQLQSKDKHTLSLSTTKMKDAHWDYAYTRTADMAQGATYENVITTIKGKGMLTNIRRAYIDITRASHHVKLITDNTEKTMMSWMNNETNKASAIETRDKHYPDHPLLFNDRPTPKDNPAYQDINGRLDIKTMGQAINQQLPAFTESLATQLLGQPDPKKSDRDTLTFQQPKGELKVTLTGQYRGHFKNWGTGENGTLISLMMNKEGLSYTEALFKADSLISEPDKHQLTKNPHHEQLKDIVPLKQSQLEARAQQYFNDGIPVTNTLAQTYLDTNPNRPFKDNDSIRYHPRVYSSETRSTHPALIAKLETPDNQIKGIEVTYLNESTGDISDLKINKRVLGTKSGNHIPINEGIQADYSILAVGIESALFINDNNPTNTDIIAVSNNNDCRTVNTDSLRENIIIVLNQENTQISQHLIDDITSKIERDGKHATIIDPNDINHTPNSTLLDHIKTAIHNITTKDDYIPDAITALTNDINIAIEPDTKTPLTETEKGTLQDIAINDHIEKQTNIALLDKETTLDINTPQFEIDRELTR